MNASRCPDLGNWFFFFSFYIFVPSLFTPALFLESSSSLRDLTLPMLIRSINARFISRKGFLFSENKNVWKWSSGFLSANFLFNLMYCNLVYCEFCVMKKKRVILSDTCCEKKKSRQKSRIAISKCLINIEKIGGNWRANRCVWRFRYGWIVK